ncbi:hypothetical protein FHX79_111675 [Streptomyces cavourensis]|uniref:hypothetical protein n=1 Tax=Streptomyces TaxID=1883 RepID=UPI00115391B3|nr:hypothetical protein [Streptomyces cavourensis]TQO29862.1 hypothetical protein FHX79_111675 [Streptomyces cavourensis]WAE65836.1 hypothetical protein OUQ49_08790 [Streptomyces cavourensis]GGU59571.1 hypothetical protein GCM10010498_16100 [Streptomyces cavourensis]
MTRPSHTAPAHRLWEPESVARLRSLTAELTQDLATARWTPTELESHIADLLLTSAAGDGALTGQRIRGVLWEGSMALTRANDGRLAGLLASLAPVADEPELSDRALMADVHAVLDRVAGCR